MRSLRVQRTGTSVVGLWVLSQDTKLASISLQSCNSTDGSHNKQSFPHVNWLFTIVHNNWCDISHLQGEKAREAKSLYAHNIESIKSLHCAQHRLRGWCAREAILLFHSTPSQTWYLGRVVSEEGELVAAPPVTEPEVQVTTIIS